MVYERGDRTSVTSWEEKEDVLRSVAIEISPESLVANPGFSTTL